MKIRKSKERAKEVFVTIKSTAPEGSAQFVYEKLIELVEKENRLRKKEGRRALGYTIQMEGPEDWKAQNQAEPTQGDTEVFQRTGGRPSLGRESERMTTMWLWNFLSALAEMRQAQREYLVEKIRALPEEKLDDAEELIERLLRN